MWSKLRTIGLVTLVTVLIWVWADAETQRGGGELLHGDTPRSPVVDEAELIVETLPVTIGVPARGAGGEGGEGAKPELVRSEVTELKRVAITGPRNVIERIKAGDATVRPCVLLVLDERDMSGGAGAVSKSVELLPTGLGLRFVGPAPTVRVTISR